MLWRGAWSGRQSRCVDPRDVLSPCTLYSQLFQIRYHSTEASLRHLCAAVEVPFTGRQQAARDLARKLLLGKGTAGMYGIATTTQASTLCSARHRVVVE